MARPLPVIGFAAAAIASLSSLRADLPLPPPQDYQVRSANGQYVAKVTVAPPMTTVYAMQEGKETQAWSMVGFYRQVFLADDGQHLVIGYNGYNLISTNYSPDMVMVTFVEQGRILRQATLRELLPDLSKLQRTVSHYHWGHTPGINNRGEFVVETVDYRELHFDVRTGNLLRTQGMYFQWFRDLLSPGLGLSYFNVAAVSCVLGIIIGIIFRGRLLFAFAASTVVNTALLFFPSWAWGSFTAVGSIREFVAALYSTGIATVWIFYLVPSTFSVVGVSLFWRRYRRLRTSDRP